MSSDRSPVPDPRSAAPRPREGGEAGSRLAWPALALWIALELVLLRGLLRLVTGLERGWPLDIALWDLGQDLAGILSGALTAALVATLPNPRGRGSLARGLWFALSLLGVAYVLAGSHLERPSARLWGSLSSPLALGFLAIGAGITLDLRRRADRPRPWLAPLGGPRGILAPALTGAFALVGFAAAFVLHPPEREVAVLVRELFAKSSTWDVRVAREDAPPRLDTTAPVQVTHVGRPTIVMPPPCEVAFQVRPEEGICRLRGGVCVDFRTARAVRGTEPWSVTFTLQKNGETVFERTVDVRAGSAPEAWIPIAGDELEATGAASAGTEGLLVRAGDELVLKTSSSGPPPARDGVPLDPATEWRVGFGGLVLERLTLQAARPASPATPNVLLVVMDTQRADRLGCYGYERPTSPHVDALAERGLAYDAAYATSSWTWPATASILTGRWPEAHGVTSNASCYLWGHELTLAEVLRDAGYLTAAFTGNNLIAPAQNFDQGFDTFDAATEFRKTDEFLPDVLDWLESHAAERFFLYLQLVDPHEPHRPLPELAAAFGAGEPPADLPGASAANGHVPNPAEEAFNVYTARLSNPSSYDAAGRLLPAFEVPAAHRAFFENSYDACVATGDHYVGQVLAELERLGLTDSTLVVFTSDHGEELFDHGHLAHGHALFEELVRVPLVIAGPGIPAGARESRPVSNKELFGTLARIARGPRDTGRAGAGLDRARLPNSFDLVQREWPGFRRVMFSTEKGWVHGRSGVGLYGLRSDDWTLHTAPRALPWALRTAENPPAEAWGELWLYAKDSDPLEHTDVAAEHAAIVETLGSELRGLLEEAREARSEDLPADPATEEILAALGYFSAPEDTLAEDPPPGDPPDEDQPDEEGSQE